MTAIRAITVLIILTSSFSEIRMNDFRKLMLTREWHQQHVGLIGFRVASIAVNNQLAFVKFSTPSVNYSGPINMYTETYKIDGSIQRKCEILNNHGQVHLVKMASFNDSRVIIAWIDVKGRSLKIQIVDVNTCKQSFDQPIYAADVGELYESANYGIVPHKTTFDLFMTHPVLCPDHYAIRYICRLRYSSTGKRLAVVSFAQENSGFWEFVPVDQYNPNSDLFHVELSMFSSQPIKVSLISIDTCQVYRSKSMEIKSFDGLAAVTYLQNGVGICAIDYPADEGRAQIGCGAFDKKLNVISETVVSLEQRERPATQDVVAVQQFYNDSMLVLMSTCSHDNCTRYDVQVQQITFGGSYSEPLKFEKSICHIPWSGLNLERVTSDEYCASYVCYEGEEFVQYLPHVITRCTLTLPAYSSAINTSKNMRLIMATMLFYFIALKYT